MKMTKVAAQPEQKLHQSSSSVTLSSLTFSRTWLAAVAKENMDIAKKGYYMNREGAKIYVRDALKRSIKSSTPYHFSQEIDLPAENADSTYDTKMYVCYSLITKAAIALKKVGANHVGVLNSADAFNPGGTFKSGCLSLEAGICRSSLLWPCLEQFKNKNKCMYKLNNEEFSSNPSSCAIFSPNVPVIRRDELEARFLADYQEVSFVSIPPPNAFAMESIEEVRLKLRDHLRRALYIFAAQGCTDLALCAFGCGTHGSDPEMVAEIYHELLTTELKGRFQRIIFAINPIKQKHYEAFSMKFEQNNQL